MRTDTTDSAGARTPFGRRLAARMADRGPLCVGIDPHPGLLDAWDLPRTAAGVERFAMTLIEAVGDRVAVLKPQSAFFERYGSAGIAVMEKTLAAGRDAGALMLLDAKRGDIGSTLTAYAEAYLADGSPLAADAVTLSPFLGVGSLQPAFDLALATGRGVFVLCRTSNPEGGQVQLAEGARVAAGGMAPMMPSMTVSGRIADHAATLNADEHPMGSIGLVVGATVIDTGADLSVVNGPLLAPGIGAQGATAADLARVFGAAVGNVLPTVSRSVLHAGPSAQALRGAAARVLDEVRAVLRPN